MPTIAPTLVETDVVHALVGTFLSWLRLVQPLHPVLADLQSTAIQLVVVDWRTQLSFGVALWMPRPGRTRRGVEQNG